MCRQVTRSGSRNARSASSATTAASRWTPAGSGTRCGPTSGSISSTHQTTRIRIPSPRHSAPLADGADTQAIPIRGVGPHPAARFGPAPHHVVVRGLERAEDLARAHDATLIPVLAWVPPGGDFADRCAPNGYLRGIWAALRGAARGHPRGRVPAGAAAVHPGAADGGQPAGRGGRGWSGPPS